MSSRARFRSAAAALILCVCAAVKTWAAAPESKVPSAALSLSPEVVDNTTFINANKILMFVTNHGNIGRDLSGTFGYDYGTFFPFTTVEAISSGADTRSPLYAAGIWLGGVDSATGDTLVTISEYSSEYVPGPMSDSTWMPDQWDFKVYKLFHDSLADHPNDDYLNWPVSQGAPIDGKGEPLMVGDQMLWTVYNDADPSQHDNMGAGPLGIEVQQTVWAADEAGTIEIPKSEFLQVTHTGTGPVTVTVTVAIAEALTGHDYMVVTDVTEAEGYHWHLIDVTAGDTLLARQTDFSGAYTPVVDGFAVQVLSPEPGFSSFEVVANANGPLDPPEPGAMASQGFPTPDGLSPSDRQQVGLARWLFHTADNGGTNGGGTRSSYSPFLDRTFRVSEDGGARWARLGDYDWEMRFTGSNSNPGVGGGYAWDYYGTMQAYWVPFELWRIGINTPDDPSDDLRLIPWMLGDYTAGEDNFVYDLSQYGSAFDGSCHDGCEHSVSAGDNDPYTDWVYWLIPADVDSNMATVGDSAYLVFENAMKTDPLNWPGFELPVMDRTVLVNWNGGTLPPFNQDLPEQGTIFRLVTTLGYPDEEFTFTAGPSAAQPLTSGPDGMSVYVKYKLVNKGTRTLSDFFISFWTDPDLGGSGDDLVGCDTLDNRFFCYNGGAIDAQYGYTVPAFGVKVLEGPIVPSPGDTATVDGLPVPDYANLNMHAFIKYVTGTDPDSYQESYCFMKGLQAKAGCAPYIYDGHETRFMHSGDPVTGLGDLDVTPDDRRMMASFGPLSFRPGDTQQVVLKLAVGQGTDRLSSITALREVLEYERVVTDVDDEESGALPREFALSPNYPNPFNAATTIRYALPEKAHVRIEVINLLGQKVTTLVDRTMPSGQHSAVWNGTDASGKPVASGVYFYRLTTGDFVQTRKMMLLK